MVLYDRPVPGHPSVARRRRPRDLRAKLVSERNHRKTEHAARLGQRVITAGAHRNRKGRPTSAAGPQFVDPQTYVPGGRSGPRAFNASARAASSCHTA